MTAQRQPFHPKAAHAFTAVFEAHWQRIRDECLAVQDRMVDYVETGLYGAGWKVFILQNFQHREPVVGNDLLCPFTAGLVRTQVARPGVVCFSRLEPGTVIRPHEGREGPYLRCHLGLQVPEGDCALQLAGESRRWREGEAMVFDDRFRHGAHNLAAQPRTVLLFDFIP